MILYPSINPVAFSIGPIAIHWYGIMYLIGFAMAYGLAHVRVKQLHLTWSSERIGDLIFYAALGVALGGKLGYMIFYHLHEWRMHPLAIFARSGMSFHGGLIGVLIAMGLFSRKIHTSFWTVADLVAPLVPLGLAAGRLGNFINGELWGRVTTMPWGMVFPHVDAQPRHPSQLYELGLEGLALFLLVGGYALKPRPRGCVSAVFLIGYACCRLLVECFREPDSNLGVLHGLTMGQWLSLPMLLGGVFLYFGAIKRHASLS